MPSSRVHEKAKPFFRWWLPRLGWPVAGMLAIGHYQDQRPAPATAPTNRLVPMMVVPEPVPMSLARTPPRLDLPATDAPPLQRAWHWRELESSDYATYIQKLRSVGCPEQTIVDLVLMDVGRVYQARREQLQRGRPSPGQEPDEAWLALAQERNQLVRQLVGVDFNMELAALMEDFTPGTRVPALDFLPLDKQVVARRLIAVEQEKEEQLVEASAGVMDEAQSQKLKEIRAQAEQQLRGLLSPEEFAAYRAQVAAP